MKLFDLIDLAGHKTENGSPEQVEMVYLEMPESIIMSKTEFLWVCFSNQMSYSVLVET